MTVENQTEAPAAEQEQAPQPPQEQAIPLLVDIHRRIPAVSIQLSDADDEGSRVLEIDTASPDTIVVLLPAPANDYLKGVLTKDTIQVAKAGDIAAVNASKKG